MKGVTRGAVCLAIRHGRLAAIKIVLPPSTKKRPGRSVWRIAPQDAEAWDAEDRQPRAGAVVVDPGPKRDGELSIAEAVALKGVTETALRQAIHTHRLSARWSPHDPPAPTAVPSRGNTHQGHWYINREDLLAWRPGHRNAGGAGSSPNVVKAADDMTVPEVAALKGITAKAVRKAIYQGRLPAQWAPWEIADDPEDTRLSKDRRPGRWLIKKSDAAAYANPILPADRVS